MRRDLGRTAALTAAAWLVAVGVTGSAAWGAVSVLDSREARTGLLTAAQVDEALAAARAAEAAVPRPARTPTPGSSAPAVQGVQIARTWTLDGGTVAATCTGEVIALTYATPKDGWTVEVHSVGPDRLEVELHRSDQEILVRGSCIGGEPVPDVRTDSDAEDGTRQQSTDLVTPSPQEEGRETPSPESETEHGEDPESHETGAPESED